MTNSTECRVPCVEPLHSWRATDFKFAGHRPGGGIANTVHRICETCGDDHHQVEVSWPDDRITVEAIP